MKRGLFKNKDFFGWSIILLIFILIFSSLVVIKYKNFKSKSYDESGLGTFGFFGNGEAGYCGDDACCGSCGENFDNCPLDCPGGYCGDGICNAQEEFADCPVDCHGSGNSCTQDFQCGDVDVNCIDERTYLLDSCCDPNTNVCTGSQCIYECPEGWRCVNPLGRGPGCQPPREIIQP